MSKPTNQQIAEGQLYQMAKQTAHTLKAMNRQMVMEVLSWLFRIPGVTPLKSDLVSFDKGNSWGTGFDISISEAAKWKGHKLDVEIELRETINDFAFAKFEEVANDAKLAEADVGYWHPKVTVTFQPITVDRLIKKRRWVWDAISGHHKSTTAALWEKEYERFSFTTKLGPADLVVQFAETCKDVEKTEKEKRVNGRKFKEYQEAEEKKAEALRSAAKPNGKAKGSKK